MHKFFVVASCITNLVLNRLMAASEYGKEHKITVCTRYLK